MRLVWMMVIVVVSLVVGTWMGNALGDMLGLTPLTSPVKLYVVTVRHWAGLVIGPAAALVIIAQVLRRWREHDAERAMFRRARTEAQIRQIKY